MTDKFNQMQQIKREFFAYRNGIIADTLRKNGANYRIIFGLNLPQLVEIANRNGKDRELAQKLWENTSTRESLLLAPMIFPAEDMDKATALKWISEVYSAEVGDILCHRLLRHLPFAFELATEIADNEKDLERYCSLRLLFNLLPKHIKEAEAIATKEAQRNNDVTKHLAQQLIEEIEFLKE
jgi:3-methyladenine DNA glycosylase AlkD